MYFLSRPGIRSVSVSDPHCSRAIFAFRLHVLNVQKAGEEPCGDRLRFGHVRPFPRRRVKAVKFSRGLRSRFPISDWEYLRRLR